MSQISFISQRHAMSSSSNTSPSSPSPASFTSLIPEHRSSTRERNAPRRWSAPIPSPKYPQGPPRTPEEELHAIIDAVKLPARALAAADDVLVRIFDNPRVRLAVRTIGKHALPTQDSTLLKRSFDGSFKARMGYPQWQADTFTEQMQSHGLVASDNDDATAFSNLALRYARLKFSSRIKIGHASMNGKVEARVMATSPVPRGTLILELGGIMSADAIDESPGPLEQSNNRNLPRKGKALQSAFERFSVVWKGNEQSGPGPKKDRLLLGPARFVNHSCTPNCKLRPFPKTNAWGVETIRDVLEDEEITVNYGQYYFAPGECACAPCRARMTDAVETPATSLAPSPAPPSSSLTEHAEIDRIQIPSKKRQRLDQEMECTASRPTKKARR